MTSFLSFHFSFFLLPSCLCPSACCLRVCVFLLSHSILVILSLHHNSATPKVRARCSMLMRGGYGDGAKRKCEWPKCRVRVSSVRLRPCESRSSISIEYPLPSPSSASTRLIREIGIGLIGFGLFFTFLGIILFFDRGLLALGNIFSLAGVGILLGWRSTWALFTNRANFKALFSPSLFITKLSALKS
ncbi:Vesicle transport protein GOT1 [Glycine max]|nr:Vesicle transport protein GOT1 [Glycine max]